LRLFLITLSLVLIAMVCSSVIEGQTSLNKQQLLERHNYYREQVNVPPLKWSEKLAKYAQEWADKLAKKCELKHRTEDKFGENIYWSSGEVNAENVVNFWAKEEKYFNHRRPIYKYGKGYGHYTQMIWKDTKFVGAAVANCKNGGQIWVCNYDPAGNWEDERVY